MRSQSICHTDDSQLVIIDMQERLANAMPAEDMKLVLKQTSILLQAANQLEVPVIHTEQYPKGLGPTCEDLLPLLNAPAISKTAFSCCDEPNFQCRLAGDRPQVILAGMEAHICVLQTALGLVHGGHRVAVVQDAVGSRNPRNRDVAMARMIQNEIEAVTTEMVLFEWMEQAGTDEFRALSKLVK